MNPNPEEILEDFKSKVFETLDFSNFHYTCIHCGTEIEADDDCYIIQQEAEQSGSHEPVDIGVACVSCIKDLRRPTLYRYWQTPPQEFLYENHDYQ